MSYSPNSSFHPTAWPQTVQERAQAQPNPVSSSDVRVARPNSLPTLQRQSLPGLVANAQSEYGTTSPLRRFLLSNYDTPALNFLTSESSTLTPRLWQPPQPLYPQSQPQQIASEDDDTDFSEHYSEFTVNSSYSENDLPRHDNEEVANHPHILPHFFTPNFTRPSTTTEPQTHIDLTEPSPPRTMSASQPFKRSFTEIDLDLEEEPSISSPASKRVRHTALTGRTPQRQSKIIEEIDLVSLDKEEEDGVAATLQKQRAEAVKAQQQSPENKSKLSTLQCTVCLDTPDELTATSCGHTFCRSCLMNWLIAGEKETTRRPNCPACRKPLKRTSKTDTIPLEIMKRPKGGGSKSSRI